MRQRGRRFEPGLNVGRGYPTFRFRDRNMLALQAEYRYEVNPLISGAIFVERAFGLPGIGPLLFSSLARRDLPVILGIVVLVTTAILLFNLIVDLLYPLLDPRVRHVQTSTERAPRRARRERQPERAAATAP